MILAAILVLIFPLGAVFGQNPWQSPEEQETSPNEQSEEDGAGAKDASDEPDEPDEIEENEDKEKGSSWREHIYWDNALYLDTTWNNLRIRFGGDIQNDTAGFLNTDSAEEVLGVPIEDGVQWRRARIDARGTFGKYVRFRFRWDFTSANPPHLQDAHIGLTNLPIPTLEIMAGRFREPLGLEGTTGANDTTFMERSLTSTFLPQRDTGLLFYGDAPRRKIRWTIGVLRPEEEERARTSTDNTGISGRFAGAFHPKSGKALVHLGINLWRRNVDPSIGFSSRPESGIAPRFVDTGEISATSLNLGIAETAVQRGPFSVQGEFVPANVKSTDQGQLFFYAFYVMGSYVLTGETRPYSGGRFGRPHPQHELRDGAGGKGAFEVAFRFSRIDLNDKSVTGGELNDLTAAFNWYPTNNTRTYFNVIRADLKGAAPVWIFQMRLQIAF